MHVVLSFSRENTNYKYVNSYLDSTRDKHMTINMKQLKMIVYLLYKTLIILINGKYVVCHEDRIESSHGSVSQVVSFCYAEVKQVYVCMLCYVRKGKKDKNMTKGGCQKLNQKTQCNIP